MLRIRRFAAAFVLWPLLSTTCAHIGAHAGMPRLRIECCVSQEVLVAGEWRQKCGIPLALAKVLIDGNEAGACNEWGGDGKYVGAGSHHVEVQDTENQRCFNYSGDVELPPGGEVVVVSALLGPMPD